MLRKVMIMMIGQQKLNFIIWSDGRSIAFKTKNKGKKHSEFKWLLLK